MSKRPVAFRVKDYADGWILFQDEEAAYSLAEETDALMQGLYVRDGTEPESETRLRAALEKAYTAMTLARALPGVAQEYDFDAAIQCAESALGQSH